MVAENPGDAVVVDTDVISFIFKNHILSQSYVPILSGRSLAVSLITLAEVEYGMGAAKWGVRRRELMARFLSRFTLLPPDRDTAMHWARIRNERERKGRPISFPDAWIAAAAMQLGVPLVTHNARDYGVIEGLTILTAEATG